jgi:hypothetical protein
MVLGMRTGLAICKGLHAGSPRTAWQTLCPRYRMCPSCESVKAGRRASKLSTRLESEYELADGDLTIGVLTTTLPGRGHPIRRGTLREQYDYLTRRVRFQGEPGDHSMRGLNRLLERKGARGGSHFIEFTYNSKKGWWNTHMHSLFWAWEKMDDFQETTEYHWDPAESLLQTKTVGGKRTRMLPRLGLGERYSLDYAEDDELELMIRYSSKVAYATKPFKAPISKSLEIAEFLQGDSKNGLPEPRLARPFGEGSKPGVMNVLS